MNLQQVLKYASIAKRVGLISKLIAHIQVQYAGQLLYILALGLAKLSVCIGLSALSPESGHRRLTSVFIVTVIIWLLVAFVGTAFQCGSHGPWESNDSSCIDRVRDKLIGAGESILKTYC